MLKWVGKVLTAMWVAVFIGLISIAAMQHLAPSLGRQLVVIRGGSMEPSIPIGAVVLPRAVTGADIRVGDVVTMRTPGSLLSTHRVVAIHAASGPVRFETKGDANGSPDPVLVTEQDIVGRVDLHVPWLGYILTLLSHPSGMLAVVAGQLALMGGAWLVEDLGRPRRRTVGGPALDAPEV